MEQSELVVCLREKKGKQANKKLRKSGYIPAVVYGSKEEPIVVSCEELSLKNILHTSAGGNVIFSLKIMDKDAKKEQKTETVMIKEMQQDPIKEDILHIDFNHISLTEKITVKIPVEIKGEAAGVKMGGLVEHVLWEVEVECLPADIPEKISLNISELEIGQSLQVKDIPAIEGVEILVDPEQTVVAVEAPKAEEEAVVSEVEEDIEQAEPEVIKQKEEPESPESKEEPKK